MKLGLIIDMMNIKSELKKSFLQNLSQSPSAYWRLENMQSGIKQHARPRLCSSKDTWITFFTSSYVRDLSRTSCSLARSIKNLLRCLFRLKSCRIVETSSRLCIDINSVRSDQHAWRMSLIPDQSVERGLRSEWYQYAGKQSLGIREIEDVSHRMSDTMEWLEITLNRTATRIVCEYLDVVLPKTFLAFAQEQSSKPNSYSYLRLDSETQRLLCLNSRPWVVERWN